MHACGRRTFGSQLCNFDLVAHKIGFSSIQLFALESTVYMTAGKVKTVLEKQRDTVYPI